MLKTEVLPPSFTVTCAVRVAEEVAGPGEVQKYEARLAKNPYLASGQNLISLFSKNCQMHLSNFHYKNELSCEIPPFCHSSHMYS